MPLLLRNRYYRGIGPSCLQFTLKQFRKSECVCECACVRQRVSECACVGRGGERELQREQANMVKCLHRDLGGWHQEFFVQSLQIFPKPEIMSK